MSREQQRGFTLIELMIVVVIIAIISGVILPRFLTVFDQHKKAEFEQVARPPQGAAEAPGSDATLPQGRLPIIDAAALTMTLESSSHRIGMEVFTRYEVHCQGRIAFRRATEEREPVLLTIPLPEGQAEARDVRLTLTRHSDGRTWEPDNLVYHQQRLYWSGMLEESDTLAAEFEFVALGREQFAYHLPPARQLRSLEIVMDTTHADTPRIPDHALQPTGQHPHRLTWRFEHLITDRMIVLDIPGAFSPVGRVLLLVRLVAVAVLLFGFGFWYLSELWQPGLLKAFRWGHFLLLALTYSLYFVIFAVISVRESIPVWLAMGIAALFSLPLVVFHVTRVIHRAFALRRAFPLALVTLALVMNGVYGGELRDYLFIAAAIGGMAYFTVTYEQWAQGRAEYQQTRRAEDRVRLETLRHHVLHDSKRLIDDLRVADLEAQELLDHAPQPELRRERYQVSQKQQPLAVLIKAYEEFVTRLPELTTAQEGLFDRKWAEHFEQELDVFGKDVAYTLEALRKAMAVLERKKRSLRAQHRDHDIYCMACGHAAPPAPYCRECGAPAYNTLRCQECDGEVPLPLHIVDASRETLTLHCPYCGEAFDPVTLRRASAPSQNPQA